MVFKGGDTDGAQRSMHKGSWCNFLGEDDARHTGILNRSPVYRSGENVNGYRECYVAAGMITFEDCLGFVDATGW